MEKNWNKELKMTQGKRIWWWKCFGDAEKQKEEEERRKDDGIWVKGRETGGKRCRIIEVEEEEEEGGKEEN